MCGGRWIKSGTGEAQEGGLPPTGPDRSEAMDRRERSQTPRRQRRFRTGRIVLDPMNCRSA
jgi:hypothetical protein